MDTSNETYLEKQLEEYRFALSAVSHEVRNPVTLINSSLQLLEREQPQLKQSDLWNNVMNDMQFLRSLLDDLSSFNNTFRCTKKETDMVSWLNDLTSSVSLLFPDKTCEYSVKIPKDLSPVSIDTLKMKQAITNLLRNAFEAADALVSFRAFEQDGQLLMEIYNDGAFIPKALQKEIFQPFATTKENGTGLGLPIAKGVLEAHGGSILLSSSELHGTVVYLCLPAQG